MGTMKMALVASTSDGSSFKRVSLFSKKGGVSTRLAGTTFADSAAIPFPSGGIEVRDGRRPAPLGALLPTRWCYAGVRGA